MIPHLPLFIALSTSSPFWNGKATGLKGYRLAAYDELPRTGIPELFESSRQYDEYISVLIRSGIMPDESYVWWAMRPSLRHPTLELRAPDVCTSVDDAIAIASLYRALARHLYQRPGLSQQVTSVDRAVAVENKWRAQRYGTECTFASREGAIGISEMLSRLIAEVAEDASALGCMSEVEHCRFIVERGSSADRQLGIYRDSGHDLSAVTRWIAASTAGGEAPADGPLWQQAVV
jgi:carboxylate-amine ligase